MTAVDYDLIGHLDFDEFIACDSTKHHFEDCPEKAVWRGEKTSECGYHTTLVCDDHKKYIDEWYASTQYRYVLCANHGRANDMQNVKQSWSLLS